MNSYINDPNFTRIVDYQIPEQININAGTNGFCSLPSSVVPTGYQLTSFRIKSDHIPAKTHFIPWVSDYEGYRLNFFNIVGQNSYVPANTTAKLLFVKS